MSTESDQTKNLGVLAHLKTEGKGYRLILDDLSDSGDSQHWSKWTHFTWRDIPKEKLESLSFDDKELADFGFNILARLRAFVRVANREKIDKSLIRWDKEIQLQMDEDGSKKAVVVKISLPLESKSNDEAFCMVSLGGLLNTDMPIYGVDKSDARANAIEFIRSFLQGRDIKLSDGKTVDIDKLPL